MIKHRNINSTVLTAKDSKHMCSFLIVTCSFNCQSKLCLKQEGKAPVLFNVCERLVSLLILFRIAFCAGSKKAIRNSMSVASISCLCDLDEDKASDKFSFAVAGTAQKILKSNKGIKYNII